MAQTRQQMPRATALNQKWTRRAFEQRHRLHHAEGHARRASAGDMGRAGPEIGGGEGTAKESPPAGRVTDETDYFRSADHSPRIAGFTERGEIKRASMRR